MTIFALFCWTLFFWTIIFLVPPLYRDRPWKKVDGRAARDQHIKELEIELGLREPDENVIVSWKNLVNYPRIDPPIYGHSQPDCHVEPIEARSKSLTSGVSFDDLIEVEIDTEAYGYFESKRNFDRKAKADILNDIRRKSKTAPPMMVDHRIEGWMPDPSRRRPRA